MGFLPYLLRRATQDILKETAGSTFPNLPGEKLERFPVALPPFAEQKRIAAVLNERMAAVERARAAAEAQLEAAKAMPAAYIRGSLVGSQIKQISLGEGLVEVCNGVGSSWDRYPVLGATRNGLAPAKEPVGKKPERYKLVNEGTIFYNPMRILLGSIAMLDDGDPAGITSPDYVVFRGVSGVLHPRWFYYWLRSSRGDDFIRTLTRGAVRERLLFRRLARASVTVPPWGAQLEAAELMKQVRPIRRKLEEELDAINKLPAALLRRAFSGAL
jgi:type I restriction enzyme S subunit